MKVNKIPLVVTTIVLLALTAAPMFRPVLGNGGPHDYISDLYVGRDHQDGGLVTVDWLDEDTLRITFETEGCWSLVETHLIVANTYAEIPTTQKGNPKIGHFPYKTEHEPMVTTFSYDVDVTGEAFVIAAHAVVYCDCQEVTETAWGQGANAVEFPGNSWALYFTFPD